MLMVLPYKTPPMLSVNEVVYVEIIKGLAAGNKYGSEGAGGSYNC